MMSHSSVRAAFAAGAFFGAFTLGAAAQQPAAPARRCGPGRGGTATAGLRPCSGGQPDSEAAAKRADGVPAAAGRSARQLPSQN